MDTRYLNEVAQKLRTFEESLAAFERLSREEQLAVLGVLEFMAHQAHATSEDVPEALTRGLVEPSFRPAWQPHTSGIYFATDAHYAKRDMTDLLQQYRYLIALYSVADERRRVDCAGQCSHWWHHLERA
jgi:hypothetical protein